jgi:hypothetical protein
VLRKKCRPPKFFAPFKPLFSRIGIHDANRPERRSLLLDNRTEDGDLNVVAPECLLRIPEYLGRGSSEGGLDCNGLLRMGWDLQRFRDCAVLGLCQRLVWRSAGQAVIPPGRRGRFIGRRHRRMCRIRTSLRHGPIRFVANGGSGNRRLHRPHSDGKSLDHPPRWRKGSIEGRDPARKRRRI